MTTVVVVGQGYVGLPMALSITSTGARVYGLDLSQMVVDTLAAGRSHIGDVTDVQLATALRSGYTPTTNEGCLADADVILVCVPTPLSEDGGPDLASVRSAGRVIGRLVRPGALVILESTTYPGTTEEIFAPLILGTQPETHGEIHVAYSPERIDPGNQIYGVSNTPKVVGGLTPDATRRAVDFYAQFIEKVIPARSAKEAEMTKLLENTFRHVNIALVNEMLRFSNELGIDLWDAIDCAETKPFGYMAFRPGPGVGGHCIPVDPSYLSHRVKAELGYAFRMVELAEEINRAAPLYVATRISQSLNALGRAVNGSTVLLAGVTYKADVADCRETPARPLAERLISWGAEVSYYDPFVDRWRIGREEAELTLACAHDLYEAAAAADVTVLLQRHAAFDLERLAQQAHRVLDTRSALLPSSKVEVL